MAFSAYPFGLQTRLQFRKAERPRSQPVPGMVAPPSTSSSWHTSTRGCPLPLSNLPGCHLKAILRRDGNSPSLVPSSLVLIQFVNYDVQSSERAVFCLLFYRLRDVCHSLLLAPRRYVEIFPFLERILRTYGTAWNTGTCLYMAWAGLGCLLESINSIVWNHNMVLRAPIYCDIGELRDAFFRGSPFISFTPQ